LPLSRPCLLEEVPPFLECVLVPTLPYFLINLTPFVPLSTLGEGEGFLKRGASPLLDSLYYTWGFCLSYSPPRGEKGTIFTKKGGTESEALMGGRVWEERHGGRGEEKVK
jgi:hypothetical protein